MSYGTYIVQLHPIVVCPLVCDGCGRREVIEVREAAECVPGDEVDGCALLALSVHREGFMERSRGCFGEGNFKLEHYCTHCAAPRIHKGETWSVCGIDVVGTGEDEW